jgi:hypothetical protein
MEIPTFNAGRKYYLEKPHLEKYFDVNTIKTYTEPSALEDMDPVSKKGPNSNRKEVLIVQTDSNTIDVLFLCLNETTRISKWHGSSLLTSTLSPEFCITSSTDFSIRFWRTFSETQPIASNNSTQNHEYLTPSVQCEFIENDINPEYVLGGFSDGSLRLFWNGQYLLSTSLKVSGNKNEMDENLQIDKRNDVLSDLYYTTTSGNEGQNQSEFQLTSKESFASICKFIFANNFLVCKADRVFLVYIHTQKEKLKDTNFSCRKESSIKTSVRHLSLFSHQSPIVKLISLSNCKFTFYSNNRLEQHGNRQFFTQSSNRSRFVF